MLSDIAFDEILTNVLHESCGSRISSTFNLVATFGPIGSTGVALTLDSGSRSSASNLFFSLSGLHSSASRHWLDIR